MKKRQVLTLYTKLLGFFIKKGKRKLAKKILNRAFLILSKKLKKPATSLIVKLFKKLNVYIEARILKNKRRSFIIPFPIDLNRRMFLIVKWFVKGVFSNKKRISLDKKILIESFYLLNKSKSRSFSFKTKNNKNAFLNRSNMHFRW